jgi:hypothetical protein
MQKSNFFFHKSKNFRENLLKHLLRRVNTASMYFVKSIKNASNEFPTQVPVLLKTKLALASPCQHREHGFRSKD